MEELLREYVDRSREILGETLWGVYLHGSAAMGCFHPARSDLDLLTVVRGPLSAPMKRDYLEMVADLHGRGPAKGIEMSVVRRDSVKPFVYPTPFELHFSGDHLAWYRRDPEEYVRKMQGVDWDLAAHCTVMRRRGRRLFGPSIQETFGEVPATDYLDSIWRDVAGAEEEIDQTPLYLTLNLARVLAFQREGLVLSKAEGGAWGLEHLPERYHPLLRGALRDYRQGEDVPYDTALCRAYAREMLEEITRGMQEAH